MSRPMGDGEIDDTEMTDLGATAFIGGETTSGPRPSESTDRSVEGWVGRTLGKYEVTSVLGKGGMGVVLKARDPLIDRDVAIKVLAAHLAQDEHALARFLAEAKSAGRLNHPNAAAIYEVGQEGSNYFLVMEFASGGSLSERLEKQGALSLLEATRAMIDACQGIAAAHAIGMVHRDVKPANFLRAADGKIKVADFGLAKSTSVRNQEMTQAGTVIGTPFFMSPEQCLGESVDARSDIYSLGAAYYSLLTGSHPYGDSTNIPQLMYAHCHGKILDPREIDEAIPPACSRIVARAMAKAPEDRYQTAKAMLADLEMVAAGLSGQTLATLPSESGNHPALASAEGPSSGRPSASATIGAGSGTRGLRSPYVIAGGIAACCLVGVLAFWRPWSSPESDSNGASTVAAPTGEPIRIGILHSLSGTMAGSESVVVDATLFAVEEINRSGGVLGRPVAAVVADGKSNPETFAREARRLIEQEKVCSIFGCWTSASRKMVKPVVEDLDHLLVYPLQYEGMETSPNVVYVGAAPNQQILPAIDWAYATLGKRRFFIVGSDYVFPRAAGEVIKDDLERRGAEIVGEFYRPLGDTDFDEIVAAIVETKPDMILNTINGDSNVAFFRALRKAGIRSAACPTMSFSVGEAEVRKFDPDDVAGDFAAWTYFERVATPANEAFVHAFHEKHPQRSVTDPMESAYVGLKLWAQAVEEAESLEPRKIRRAMLEQRLKAPDGDVRVDADTQHCYRTPRIGQIQPDGTIDVIWEADGPVAPQPYPETRTAEEWRAFLHDLSIGWGNAWAAP